MAELSEIDRRRKARQERGEAKWALVERASRLPGHLRAIYLLHARGSRTAAARNSHPGRAWWLLQHARAISDLRQLRHAA